VVLPPETDQISNTSQGYQLGNTSAAVTHLTLHAFLEYQQDYNEKVVS
jgi:hypothetical protein